MVVGGDSKSVNIKKSMFLSTVEGMNTRGNEYEVG